MSFTRKSIADHLDSYDEEISALQDSKRETLDDYRAQLAEKGFGKAQIKAEVEALKRAMRRRRAIAKTSEAEVDEADDLADEIFVEITSPAPRATPARENIEQFPPHNPETGELTDTQEQPESEQNTSVESRERQTAIEVSKPEATPKERSLPSVGPSGTAATITPSPSRAPRMAADDEAAQAQTSSAPSSLTRTPPVVDDGQPSPSANVPPAQNASSRSDVGQAGSIAGHSSGEFAQQSADLPWIGNEPEVGKAASVTLSQSEIPAFLRKTIADYRPNCLHPDMCAASGLRHCNACQKAMEAAERDVA